MRARAAGNVSLMIDRRQDTTSRETRVLVPVDAEGATEHERPVSGDVTAATRRLLQTARLREGRFVRRAPAEPMS